MTDQTTIPASLIALAALGVGRQMVPPALLTVDRRASRRSQGKSDSQAAGIVGGILASRDGARPAGWGITTAGKKERQGGPDGDWMISYTLTAPTTDEQRDHVVREIAAKYISAAKESLGLGHSDGGDDRCLAGEAARRAQLRALVAAVEADLA